MGSAHNELVKVWLYSKKSEVEAKIEYQEVIGEANPGGYQPFKQALRF